MNKIFLGVALFCSSATLPLLVSAHERQLFTIGGTDYLFVVGSLGEPIVVDDKTGVELRVLTPDVKDPTNASAAGVKPVLGLEKSLRVEISAGEKKKTFDLTTVYNSPGAYKAVFFPTVQTALSYRFTGTINNAPIDLSFTCAPEGLTAVEEKNVVTLEGGVVRTYKNGQFGCPLGKTELGFPEEGTTLYELHKHADADLAAVGVTAKEGADRSNTALILGVLGIFIGALALFKSRKATA